MSSDGARAALSWLGRLRHAPRDGHEAVALAVHALVLNHGFRPAEAAVDADAAAELPAGWGAGGYGGRYRHARSAMTFDVRAVPMGGRLVVHATPVEDDAQMHTLDVRVDQYVATGAAFPADAEPGATDWAATLQRLPDLATLVQVQLAHRVVPDAAKDGYEAAPPEENARGSASSSAGARPMPRMPLPHEPFPRQPEYPDDPLRIGPPPRRPGRNPYPDPYPNPLGGFGDDDLHAPGLPGRGGFGGGPGGLGGGNLMGPRNFPYSPNRPGRNGNPPVGIGGPRLPPGAVPPGARFDPFGPVVPDNDIELPPGPDGDGPPPDMYW